MLQSTELLLQLRIFGAGDKALGGHGHGVGIVAHPAQHAHPLVPSDGLIGVALQCDQLLKSSAGSWKVLAHLGDQSSDDQVVIAFG